MDGVGVEEMGVFGLRLAMVGGVLCVTSEQDSASLSLSLSSRSGVNESYVFTAPGTEDESYVLANAK